MSKTKKSNASVWQFQSANTNQFLDYQFPLKDRPRVENTIFRYNLHVESKTKRKTLEILPRFGLTACALLWWLLGSDSVLNQRNHCLLPCSHCSPSRWGKCYISAFAFLFFISVSTHSKTGIQMLIKIFPRL